MADPKPLWQARVLNQLQGPSSLGMALSGGAVGFSASILNPQSYVGFWMSVAFQAHAAFQFLSVAAGVFFIICRLRNNDVITEIAAAKRDGMPPGDIERLEARSRTLSAHTRTAIYAQIVLISIAGMAFFWLMLLHFRHALYP